jgi:hypothetical protein
LSTPSDPIVAGVDPSKPSIARVYDYVLGGTNNFAIDRQVAGAFLSAVPEIAQVAKDNRSFLRRGVRYLVGEAGIRQIIDIGSGLPTVGNVHEIARELDPTTRVVYVDKDPFVLAHSRALLTDNETATVIAGDLLDPGSIFDDPAIHDRIDQSQPFAVLLSGILHHLSDDQNPDQLVAAIRDRLPVGGHLLITNFVDPGEARAKDLERAFIDGGLGTGRFRTVPEQLGYFTGLDLVEPGYVFANDWRPDADTTSDSPVHSLYIAGIGRKGSPSPTPA